MILAARDVRLHEDIMRRDGGYQYKITEGGKDFSRSLSHVKDWRSKHNEKEFTIM